MSLNQKGIASIILIVGALALVLIVIGLIFFGSSLTKKSAQSEKIQTFSLKNDPASTKDCQDKDYGGCDEGSEHASWKDDGKP